MSADNYYVVRKHPSGGFTYVQGFASDEDEVLVVHPNAPQFRTWGDALDAALREYSEYGVSVHPECYQLRTAECDGMPCVGSGYIRVLTAERDDARRQVKEAITQNNREWAESALDDEAAAAREGYVEGRRFGLWVGWAIGAGSFLPVVVWLAVSR